VGEDDEFVFQLREDFQEFGDVQVLALAGAFVVVGLEKGAFGDEDFSVDHAVLEQGFAHRGVAGVGDERHIQGVGDAFAFFLHLAKDVAGEVLGQKVGTEFFTAVDEHKAQRRHGVARGEGPGDEALAQLEFIADVHGDDAVFGDFALQAGPGVDDVGERLGDFGGAEDRAGGHALEKALGEVVGDTGGVVDVAVGEEAEVGSEDGAGALADVEVDVEFGDLDDGFLAGDGIAQDVEVRGLDDGHGGNEGPFAAGFGQGGGRGGDSDMRHLRKRNGRRCAAGMGIEPQSHRDTEDRTEKESDGSKGACVALRLWRFNCDAQSGRCPAGTSEYAAHRRWS